MVDVERHSRVANGPRAGVLDVVVVTYGSKDLVGRCLDAPELRGPDMRDVYVVDNASPDGTADMVARDFPWVRLTRRESNDGFAVANNVALRSLENRYSLLLNPDAEVGSGTIAHLVDVMESCQHIGVIGCRLVMDDGRLDHAAKRMIPTPWDAVRYFTLRPFGKAVSNYVAPEIGEFDVANVDAVNGAFMLVRNEAMQQVGYLDESYWMYGEDLDWCTRFREQGWRVVYDGRVSAGHSKGGSAGVRSTKLNYAFHRSMQIYFFRHIGGPRTVRGIIASGGIWIHFVLAVVVSSVRRHARRLRKA